MRAAAPAPDPAADLALLAEAAEGAAEIALSHWRQDPKVWDKPGDEGPVTEADLAVDAYLAARLRAARPEYGWMSEETPDDEAARDAETLFIVDPIDGTRAYARGEPIWAHALAVVHAGQPVAAVVHLPAEGLRYAAAAGLGATRDGASIAPATAPPALDGARMLITRPNLAAGLWSGRVPTPTQHFRPSLAYRIALVAEGRFDGMLTLRDSWEWDVAAGALIAQEAGARVTDRSGRPLSFNTAGRKTAGVLAAPPDLHAETLARLAPNARID
jgi:myo-inositol-1(or 4)-monophosphatase